MLDTHKSIRQQIDNFERSTTYRKFAELVLIESEERYRTLFEAANDAILLIQDNQIIDCSKSIRGIWMHKAGVSERVSREILARIPT